MNNNEFLNQQQSDIIEKQSKKVIKSNTLIRKTRYSLTTTQQKIIIYITAQIKPQDKEFQKYEFSIKELCNIFGIKEHGENYNHFKKSIKELADVSFWLETEKKDILCRWIDKVEINKEDLTVSIQFDDILKPYLLELQKSFTEYEISNVLVMKSPYSIRLYEILKSYAGLNRFTISVERIKKLLQYESNTEYKYFKRDVLQKAIDEINRFTDLKIELEQIKNGRKVFELVFHISIKKSTDFYKSQAERFNKLLNTEETKYILGEFGGNENE